MTHKVLGLMFASSRLVFKMKRSNGREQTPVKVLASEQSYEQDFHINFAQFFCHLNKCDSSEGAEVDRLRVN